MFRLQEDRRHRPAGPCRSEARCPPPTQPRSATACDGTPRGRIPVQQFCFSRSVLPTQIMIAQLQPGLSFRCAIRLRDDRSYRFTTCTAVNVTFVEGRQAEPTYKLARHKDCHIMQCGGQSAPGEENTRKPSSHRTRLTESNRQIGQPK